MPARAATGVGTLRGMRSPWPSCPLCASKAAADANPQLFGAGAKQFTTALALHRRTYVVATPRVHTPGVVDDHAARRNAGKHQPPRCWQGLTRRTHLWVAAAPAAMNTTFTFSSGAMRCGSSKLGSSAFCGTRQAKAGRHALSCRTHRGRILGSDAADGAPVCRATHKQSAHRGGCGSCGFSHCGAVGNEAGPATSLTRMAAPQRDKAADVCVCAAPWISIMKQ